MSDKEKKIEELKWVRLLSPVHIPRYLIDQVRDKNYDTDDFIKYQELNCLVADNQGFKVNPFNHLYALVDNGNLVKGFLWFVIEPLTKDLLVNTFSMDKEYWFGGYAMKKASDHIKDLMKKMKIKKCFWSTNYPKHSERQGFKRSRSVLMEYALDENN